MIIRFYERTFPFFFSNFITLMSPNKEFCVTLILSNFETKNVKNMIKSFFDCVELINLDIPKFYIKSPDFEMLNQT